MYKINNNIVFLLESDLLYVSGGKKVLDYTLMGAEKGAMFGAITGVSCLALAGVAGTCSMIKTPTKTPFKAGIAAGSLNNMLILSFVIMLITTGVGASYGADLGTWWGKMKIPTDDGRTVVDFGMDGMRIGCYTGAALAVASGAGLAYNFYKNYKINLVSSVMGISAFMATVTAAFGLVGFNIGIDVGKYYKKTT